MKAAVYACTRNLYPDLEPPMKSLIAHSDVDKIYLLLEDDKFPGFLPPMAEVINVSGQKYFSKSSPNYVNGWSWIVLMRSVYTEIFPTLDRILSLDTDAFVEKDISHLWDLDMTGKFLAGAPETSKLAKPDRPYMNCGVMMMNLAHLRETGIGDEVYSALKRRKFAYPEQDAFNLACEGSIIFLPREYNAGIGTAPYGSPIIRHHMAEQKTYRDGEDYKRWKATPWDAVLKKWEARK